MEQARFKRRTITMEVLQSQQYKKRVRRIVFYTSLFLVVTLIFLTVAFAVFFRIRDINITGNERYTNEEILSILPIKAEDNLYSFKTVHLESVIRKSFPFIGDIKVTRSIPSQVNIEITEAKPVMYINVGTDYYLLSDQLRVLARTDNIEYIPHDIIKLNVSEVFRCIVGETLSFVDTRSYDSIIELYQNITNNNIQKRIENINIESRFDIYLQYEDKYSVYMGDMNNAELKIQFLTVIVQKIREENLGKSGTIDISDYIEATADLA